MIRSLPVALLATLSAGALYGATYLPLANGNTWTYREATTGQSLTVRVGVPLALRNGRVYHSLNGYAQKQLWVRNDENGQLVYLEEDSERETLLTSFQPGEAWWTSPYRECTQQGQTQAKRTPYNGPGGSWEDTLVIRYRTSICNDAGLDHEQYAENIGMVRRVVHSIAGPRAYELVYARVGTSIIEGGDRGRFSISAVPDPRLRQWQVTLRVDMGFAPSIPVRFPSSQDYDLIVRNSSGVSVYTWSMFRSFAQAERVVNIGTGWTATIDVPWPAPTGDPNALYTLEAFLTTGIDQPKFAATTALVVPQVSIGLGL
ncbi:MAG: hypothetical protein JST93_19605 [Acidobacteria bacterium]|nr:hypothetical protein [Acidobacteriota bacterium]